MTNEMVKEEVFRIIYSSIDDELENDIFNNLYSLIDCEIIDLVEEALREEGAIEEIDDLSEQPSNRLS